MNSINKTMEEIKDYKCMVCGGKVEYCFEARESNVQRFTCSKCNIVYNLWGLNVTDAQEALMSKKQQAMKEYMKENGICVTE